MKINLFHVDLSLYYHEFDEERCRHVANGWPCDGALLVQGSILHGVARRDDVVAEVTTEAIAVDQRPLEEGEEKGGKSDRLAGT